MKVLSNAALAFNKGFIQCPSSDISSCSIEDKNNAMFLCSFKKAKFYVFIQKCSILFEK